MKKIALIISHEGADSSVLGEILNFNSRVQFLQTKLIYDHPEVLEQLTNHPHKISNSAAVWCDELLDNLRFTHKSIYKICKFIYLIREPKPALNLITSSSNRDGIVRYYCYRLRRIYEMARDTPGSLFLNWEDLYTGRSFVLLEKFLGLKESLVADQSLFCRVKSNPFVTSSMIGICQNAYERYMYRMKNLPHLQRFDF